MHEIIPQLGRVGSDGLRHSIHDTIRLAVHYSRDVHPIELDQLASEVRANIEAYVDQRIADDRKEQREKLRQQWERTWDEFNTSVSPDAFSEVTAGTSEMKYFPPAGSGGTSFKNNRFARDRDDLIQNPPEIKEIKPRD